MYIRRFHNWLVYLKVSYFYISNDFFQTYCQLILEGIGKVYLNPTEQIVLKVKPTHITNGSDKAIVNTVLTPRQNKWHKFKIS